MYKSKTGRLILALGASLVIAAGAAPIACASTEEPPEPYYQVTPRYALMNFARSKLSVSKDGTLDIYITADGSTSVSEISVETTLQKKTLFWWSDVETFTDTAYDNSILMNETASVEEGTYRLSTAFTFSDGEISETHNNTSNEVTVK